MKFYIKPGHYVTVDSKDSDQKNIIRIIGEDRKHPGNWLTSEKRSISEYELQNYYVPFHTAPSNKVLVTPSAKPPPFGDIESIQVPDILPDDPPAPTPAPTPTPAPKPVTASASTKKSRSPEARVAQYFADASHPVQLIEDTIMNKCSVKTLDSQGYSYKDPEIEIKLKFRIGYDLPMLKECIRILSLDYMYIAKAITKQLVYNEDTKEMNENLFIDLNHEIIELLNPYHIQPYTPDLVNLPVHIAPVDFPLVDDPAPAPTPEAPTADPDPDPAPTPEAPAPDFDREIANLENMLNKFLLE
jgi:sulfur relay (sulfurtransferase) DsrC/TusE family protein